ncbi:TonB-dependent receptor [Thalassotalea sp. PLHSN55]|uniref:TonB-dependent receptor n=1 Tax=Thalassotalea sp. PLHSN55 TaxID=3435888 RepID=UPI003F842C18
MKTFKKSQIATSLAVALSVGAVSLVQAPLANAAEVDDKAEEQVEVIEVRGIRSSVIRAMDLKRSSSGVMDAISAEDIGKMPDTNLAESLQRIPGVSIDRANNEGNQITVRGFGPSFNMVTLNGRVMPYAASPKQDTVGSGTQARAFNFAEISSESVSGVEIYKTANAEQASGGIGATVNITSARPFDYDGFKAVYSVKGVMDTSNEVGDDITPELSGMLSSKFLDNKLGVLVAYSHAQRDSREAMATSDGWLRQGPACEQGYTTSQCPGLGAEIDDSAIDTSKNPDSYLWRAQNYNMDVSDHSRTRQNGQVVVQFAPTKDLVFTADYVMSRFEDEVERHQVAHWFGNWVGGITDANGTVVKTTSGAGGTDFIGYHDRIETNTDSIGFNADWQITDTFKASFDYHHSTAHAQPDGLLSDKAVLLSNSDFTCQGPGTACYFGGYDIDYSQGTDIPVLGAPVPIVDSSGFYPGANIDLNGRDHANADPYDPQMVTGNLAIGRGNEAENTIDQWQLDFVWINSNDDALSSISFGLGQQAYEYDTTWRFHQTTINQLVLGDAVSRVSTDGLLTGFSGSETLFPYYMDFNVDEVYQQIENDIGITYNPDTYNSIEEDTLHAYFQMEFDSEFAGFPVGIVAGFRYEKTDTTGSTNQDTVTHLRYMSLTELRPQYTGENYAVTEFDGSYDVFLPNLNVNVELTDDILVRAAYGRSITRSDLVALRPAAVIANSRPGGPYLSYQGNAELLPYESDNIDLSVEWYYDEGSYLSAAYYKKWVGNYISNSTTTGAFYNDKGEALTEPSVNPTDYGCPANGDATNPACLSQQPGQPEIVWQITTPENAEDAEVSGIELAVQHLFGESGFGIQANATFVDGDVEYDVYDVSEQLALLGLSDSANFVAFYDRNGLQARIAYNWRDEFLLATDQLRAPDEPVFTEEYGQWDANISYDVMPELSVFVEAINITGEDSRQHGRFENQLVGVQEYEARYNIGIRGSF